MKLNCLCKHSNHSPSCEICCLLQSPNVHCHIHKSWPFPILNQINPNDNLTDYLIPQILLQCSQTSVCIFHLSHTCYMPHPFLPIFTWASPYLMKSTNYESPDNEILSILHYLCHLRSTHYPSMLFLTPWHWTLNTHNVQHDAQLH
jgi:hypothetical protein